MSEEEIKGKILDIFNSERNNSSEDFEEAYFMDFLTSPAHKKNTIKNSFKGVRKYYRFMDKLELEFGVCFTLSDLDTYYSVDQLTKKVVARIKKKKGNTMILLRRNKEKDNFYFETTLVLLLVGVFYWFGIGWTSILATVVFIRIVYWLLRNKIYTIRHNKKMDVRLKNKNEKD